MKNFLTGLGFGLLGLAIWVVASIIAGTAEAFEEVQPWFGSPLMIVGFVIMVGAPLVFWIIIPVIGVIRHRREGNMNMKTILKIGCGVLLGLGVLGIIGVVLIGQCLPPAPKHVTPTPETLPPSSEKPAGKLIEDLAYIKAYGWMTYSDDADPEPEGVEVSISWYDSKSSYIHFRNIPVSVTTEMFTSKLNLKTLESEPDRSVYKGETQIDSSTSEIRIPFEQINTNPNVDHQFGVGKVTVHTPQQGDFSAELAGVMLYESH